MNKLSLKCTLPELQEQLDGLREGALFQISRRDYERLFGASDVAARNCAISRRRTLAL